MILEECRRLVLERKSKATRISPLASWMLVVPLSRVGWGGGGTPYNGLHWEAPPKRGYHNFFKLHIYKRI